MARLVRFGRTLALIVLNGLLLSTGLTVNFIHQGPLYVAPGKTLVLEAQFQLQQGETIKLYAWDRKNGAEEIRLVTQNQVHVERTSVRNNGQLLMVGSLTASDYGKYTVTVTNNNGDQVPKSIEVLEAKRPPDVSLALKCTVTPQGALVEAPVFSWLVDGQTVTNESGKLSPDGSVLYLSNNLDRNYTCIIDSSQGMNNKQVKIPDPEPKPESSYSNGGVIALIVIQFIVILGLIVALIVLYLKFIRCQRPNQNSY